MSERACFYHYLPVNDVAMRWGIYVTGGGHAKIRPAEEYPPKGHPRLYDFAWSRGRILPEFQIIFISDGEGRFESWECGEIPVQSPAVIFLVPGAWHRYQPVSARGWTESWLSFNGELAHRWLQYPPFRLACAVRQVHNAAGFGARFSELVGRIDSYPTQNSILLSMYVMTLLADAFEESVPQIPPTARTTSPYGEEIGDSLVVQARELIWTQSHRELSVMQIARDLGIARRTLERRFHAATGSSLLQDITECRLGRAKRLLAETDLPVKNVAYLSGFPSEEQMRVTFLKLAGSTPSGYRRKAYRKRKPRHGA